jgi:hypothetical protein
MTDLAAPVSNHQQSMHMHAIMSVSWKKEETWSRFVCPNRHCAADVNACINNPCTNGTRPATCRDKPAPDALDDVDGRTCTCLTGYSYDEDMGCTGKGVRMPNQLSGLAAVAALATDSTPQQLQMLMPVTTTLVLMVMTPVCAPTNKLLPLTLQAAGLAPARRLASCTRTKPLVAWVRNAPQFPVYHRCWTISACFPFLCRFECCR